MEVSQNHTHIQQSDSMHNVATLILWSLAGTLNIMSNFNLENIWTWGFRALSAFSILLVIIINWPKAKEVLFKKKKNDGN